ncbi:MAG: helix-turn-helix transcriptional regulator, partial [Armatimonadota bacterium]
SVMQETRQKLVELLRVRGGQTVEDLARALHLTRTAVTTQLATLQSEGFVRRQGLRPGRRRPSGVYALTPSEDSLFPKSYADFAAAVLDALKREGAGNLQRVLRRVGDRWIARDLPRVEGLEGWARLEQARGILAERGFMPDLQAMGNGFLLREFNCPAMRLAVEHPEVCDMVHRWMEAIFGKPLRRVQCLRQGDPYSAYTIRLTGRGSSPRSKSRRDVRPVADEPA